MLLRVFAVVRVARCRLLRYWWQIEKSLSPTWSIFKRKRPKISSGKHLTMGHGECHDVCFNVLLRGFLHIYREEKTLLIATLNKLHYEEEHMGGGDST